MRNKVLEYSVCPLGSNNGRKNDILKDSLVTYFKKKVNDILGDDWPSPVDAHKGFEIFILPQGVKKRSKNDKSIF